MARRCLFACGLFFAALFAAGQAFSEEALKKTLAEKPSAAPEKAKTKILPQSSDSSEAQAGDLEKSSVAAGSKIKDLKKPSLSESVAEDAVVSSSPSISLQPSVKGDKIFFPAKLDDDLGGYMAKSLWLEAQTGLSAFRGGKHFIGQLPISLQYKPPLAAWKSGSFTWLFRAEMGWIESGRESVCFSGKAIENLLRGYGVKADRSTVCRIVNPPELYYGAATGFKISIFHRQKFYSSVELTGGVFNSFSGRWPDSAGWSGSLMIEPFLSKGRFIIPSAGIHALHYKGKLYFGFGFRLGVNIPLWVRK